MGVIVAIVAGFLLFWAMALMVVSFEPNPLKVAITQRVVSFLLTVGAFVLLFYGVTT